MGDGYRNGSEIRVRPQGCINQHIGLWNCCKCEDVCPTDAITLSSAGPVLSSACLGCGRCASVCPTKVFEIEPIVAALFPPQRRTSFAISCHRASASAYQSPELTVRCLGAMAPSDWLNVVRKSNGRPVVLHGPAVCATCPAGGREAPWADALAETARLLDAAGLPSTLAPRAIRTTGQSVTDGEIDRPEPTRRRLLGMLAPLGTRIVCGEDLSPAQHGKLHATEPRAQAAALRALGVDEQVAAMPSAAVASTCDGCGICSSVCPTPAIRLADVGEGSRQIEFSGADCIRCGRCEAACPPKAITIHDRGGSLDRVVIHSIALAACASCGDDFASDGTAELCPVCRRTASLAADPIFGVRFGDAQWALSQTISTRE